MLGRVIAVLFSSTLIAASVFAQCTYQLQSSWAFRASYLDLAIDGNDLWAATAYGIQLFDRSGEPVRPIAHLAVPGLTRIVRARDTVAYAGSGTSIHVIRRVDARLEIVRSLDLGATINDLLLHNATLFAATTGGITPIDVARPLEPVALPPQLSGRNVLSLARSDSALFAADGDTSVEVFSLSGSPGLPIASTTAALSVKVTGARLYVSDGQQSEVFNLSGGTAIRIGTMPFGTTSLAQGGNNVIFVAGNDRRLRALDISTLESPIDLFTVDMPFTSGTINRVGTILTAGTRMYAGGGDSGLFVYDTAAFTSPYASRNYFVGTKTSVVASNTAVYLSSAAGGLTEMTRSAGSLTLGRSWGGTEPSLVHDTANDFLLTSSGKTLTYWTVRSSTPAIIATATFAEPIQSAILSGSTAYTLLTNGSLWSADMAQLAPVPVRIGNTTYAFLARSGSAIATAEVTSEGATIISFYSSGNLSAAPATSTVAGAATTFALGGARAALFTFRGITVVDFGATPPLQTVLPQSTTALVNDLAIAGSKLLDVTANGVRVWNLTSFTLERQFAIAEPLEIAVAPDVAFAAVTTAGGVAAISFDAPSQQPILVSAVAANEFHRKAAGSSDRLYLFDGTSVDVFELTRGGPPAFMTTIPVRGVIDIAASQSALFTLSNTGVVTMYSKGGAAVRSGTLDEGPDVVPFRIFAVAGAPWVAFSIGCTTTGCEHGTAVFDPQTLAVTVSIPGGVLEVATSAANAAAIFELPAEVRYYDVSDPLQPGLRGSRTAEGGAMRIATAGSSVFTLGDRLYTYSAPGLIKSGEQWPAQTPTAATRVAIDGPCAIVTGRSAGAEVYVWSSGQWTPAGVLPLPSGVRSVVTAPERFTILTDHSAEIWSRGALVQPKRRRASR